MANKSLYEYAKTDQMAKYMEMLNIGELYTLNEYMNNKAFLRLYDISYFCGMDSASKAIYDFAFPISRAEHSITTSLITSKCLQGLPCNNKRAMRIAALYHDIKTPIFSHVIDYMKGDAVTQSITEEGNDEFIETIPNIHRLLEADELSISDIDHKKYSIVDTERPRLCADRLDGIILTSLSWTRIIDLRIAKSILNEIQVFTNEDSEYEIGFKTKETADYVEYLEMVVNANTHTKEDTYCMLLLANITRHAINKGYLTEEELYHLTEPQAFDILDYFALDDEELFTLLTIFRNVNGVSKVIDMPIKHRIVKPLYPGCPKRF